MDWALNKQETCMAEQRRWRGMWRGKPAGPARSQRPRGRGWRFSRERRKGCKQETNTAGISFLEGHLRPEVWVAQERGSGLNKLVCLHGKKMISVSWCGTFPQIPTKWQKPRFITQPKEGHERIQMYIHLHKGSLEGRRRKGLKLLYIECVGDQMDGDRHGGGDRLLHVCLFLLF